ncbi:MAG: response regulator [Pseudomonadota bacterium]|nr:response regulator [Pseudomonadota bacterium]
MHVYPKFHILIVEDEPIIRKVLQDMLENIDYECDSADTGSKAVKLALTNIYDIILLDINLPDVSGISVTQQLRDAGINTPIIATTAHTLVEERLSFIAAGMNDVLAKPISQEQLAKTIDKWLSVSQGSKY